MTTKKERTIVFKKFQSLIKKEETFDQGIQELLTLRIMLFEIATFVFVICNKENSTKLKLKNDKTIAYYLYHLTRIEDITCNTLLKDKQQIFFENNFDKLLNSKIITTGNELEREDLEEFSKNLNFSELKNYLTQVYEDTNIYIKNLTYKRSKETIPEIRKKELNELNVVSKDEKAAWLIDYWCKKNTIQICLMPFSRHLMLHLDGCIRIMKKLKII